MKPERLQKILAKAGIASRRAAERLITEGRVRVNGRIITELGARAHPIRDRVEVDGTRLVAEKPVYYLLHKPREVVTTLDDPEGRQSIKDLVSHIPERVFPVGRLDFQTSGILLLTNDGDMAQALLHPTRHVPKIYSAKILGKIDDAGMEALRTGVVLDDGEKTAPAIISRVKQDDKHTWLELTISEGKNRQVHRMMEAIGRRVLRLARISFAGLTLQGLRAGTSRALMPSELNELKQKYLNPEGRVRPGHYTNSGAHNEVEVAERKYRAARPMKRPPSRRSPSRDEAHGSAERRDGAVRGKRGTKDPRRKAATTRRDPPAPRREAAKGGRSTKVVGNRKRGARR